MVLNGQWSLPRRVVVTLHNPLPLSVELRGQPPPKYVQPVFALNIEHLFDSSIPTTSSSAVRSVQTCTPFNPITLENDTPSNTCLETNPKPVLAATTKLLLLNYSLPSQANQGTPPRSERLLLLHFSQPMKSSSLAAAAVAVALLLSVCVNGFDDQVSNTKPLVKTVKGKKVCDKGWECKGWSQYCCNLTITDIFQTYQFEELFPNRNAPVAHAVGFWDYQSFILAASLFQPQGFGTTGGKLMQMKEVAAFLGHVGSKTSCKSRDMHVYVFVCT